MVKKKESEMQVILRPVEIANTIIAIVGQTPLICHRNTAILPGDPGYDSRPKKDVRPPSERMQDACYLAPGTTWDDQQFVFPGIGVKSALVTGGGRFTQYEMTKLRGLIVIGSEWIPIISDGPPEKFSVPVRIGNGSGMERRHRPMWRKWSMQVPVRFLSSHITLEEVFNLFETAGSTIGIGDWRPEAKKGPGGIYGTFAVDREGESRGCLPG